MVVVNVPDESFWYGTWPGSIDRDKLLKRTEERLESKSVDVASEIEIPKTPFFARTGHMLSLEDTVSPATQ